MLLLRAAVRSVLEQHSRLYELLEVVMDLGRPPTARFPGRDEKLSDTPVAQEDLDYAVQQVCVGVCVCVCVCGGRITDGMLGMVELVVMVVLMEAALSSFATSVH
jgi:hypothetical protein